MLQQECLTSITVCRRFESELAPLSEPLSAWIRLELNDWLVLLRRLLSLHSPRAAEQHGRSSARARQQLNMHGFRVSTRTARYRDAASTRRRLRARQIKSTQARGANSRVCMSV